MLNYLALTAIVLIAIGHIWCGAIARQKHGYSKWAIWGIWSFVINDWKNAKNPCLLMIAGALIFSGMYFAPFDWNGRIKNESLVKTCK